MKKIMIGILIIIPLLIVLTVGLVTTFVSTRVEIGVESVALDKSELTLELQDGYYKIDDLLKVTVMPERASDKSYEWSIANVHSRDPQYPDADNGKDGFFYVRLLDAAYQPANTVSSGYLDINVHCTFDLIVTAQTYSATCLVTVGKTISNVSIESADTDLTVGEKAQLNAVFTPLDGIASAVYWHSDDDNVVTVDKNGVVTATGKGSASVTLEVINAEGTSVKSAPVTFNVTEGYTRFGNSVYTHLRRMSFDELGMSPAIIAGTTGCSVDGDYLVIDGTTDRAVVNTTDGGEIMFAVCGQYDVVIMGAEYFGADYVLETQGLPLYLTVKYLSVFMSDSALGEVVWSSNDETVASVTQNGEVNTVNSGDVTISVAVETPEGNREASVEIKVRRKIAVLISEVTDTSLQAGLARETVVASHKLTNGNEEPNAFAVTVAYPKRAEGESEETFYESFRFETDKPEYAYFDTEDGNGIANNLLMFNHEALLENGGVVEIKVTVSARYPKYPNLPSYTTASFTVKVVAGVQVDNHKDMKAALEAGKNVCLAANIPLINEAGKNSAPTIYARANLYGNGYIVSAQKDQLGEALRPIITSAADNLTISNVTLRANTIEGDVDALEASTFTTGYAIGFRQSDNGNSHILGNRVEFCILENCRSLCDMKGADVEFEGCILRNTSGVGLYIDTRVSGSTVWYNNLTMTNCIMSNMIGSGMNFGYYNYTDDTYAKYPHTTFTQKGFLDIYNWQPVDNCSLIPDDVINDAGLPSDLVKTAIQSVIRDSQFLNRFKKTYDGTINIHFGFISVGLNNKSYLSSDISLEDKRFKVFDTSQIESIPSLVQNFLKYPIYVWCYDTNETQLVPGHTYVVNTKTIDKLHGIS